MGIVFIFLYNFYAYLLRSVGNSIVPLYFLAVSSVLNVVLDLYFVISLKMGTPGAAIATVISQGTAGIGCLFLLYGFYRGIGRAEMSFILTVISLGTRVVLAYVFGTDYRRNSNLVGNSYRMASGGYGGTDILQKCLPIIY